MVVVFLLVGTGCLGYAWYLYNHARTAPDEQLLRGPERVALGVSEELNDQKVRRLRDAGDAAGAAALERWWAEERARQVAERAVANRRDSQMMAYLLALFGAVVLGLVAYSLLRAVRSPAGGSP